MFPPRQISPKQALVAIGLAMLVVLPACGPDNSPTTVPTANVILTEVAIKADGQSIGGQTIHLADSRSGHVRFEACLTDRQGQPAPGGRVRLEYDIPGGMGMMHRAGEFLLCDDGTNGDITPGDGVYCYEDMLGEFGCHGTNRPTGPYHYDFCGIDEQGVQTNPVSMTVTLAP